MASVLCGVDLGGTKLGIGLVSESGAILDEVLDHDHVNHSPDEIVADMAGHIKELLARNGYSSSDLLGIGVGTAGHIRFRDGVVITMSNLPGWKGYPLRDRLEAHFQGTKVCVDNDANAQALGEYLHCEGGGFKSLVFMTISTQIGAGMVFDGRVLRGRTGTAGEIGHTIVEASGGELCPCGNRGCLIAQASGVAIPAAVRRALAAGASSKLVDAAGLGQARLDGEFIARGLAAGDGLCRAVMEDFAGYIGLGVYNVFQLLNPEAVALGGGLMNWGPPFLDAIKRRVASLARDMMYEEMVILRSGCESPGITGAASLVLEG